MSSRSYRPRQRGAILIESLIALALLSLGAAAMFHALEHLESTSHAARQLGKEVLDLLTESEKSR